MNAPATHYDRRDYAWADMLRALDRPISAGWMLNSVEYDEGPRWTLGLNYANACALMRGDYHWHEGRRVIERNARSKAAKTIAALPHVDYGFDVHGAFFDVPSVIEGRPECWMIPVEANVGERKLVRVLINVATSQAFNAKDMSERACAIGAAILALDAAGVATEVSMVQCVVDYGGATLRMTLTVRVKDAGQPLDMSRLVAVSHPAFLRRVVFRLMEQSPVPDLKGMASYYGIPADLTPDELHEITNADVVYIPRLLAGTSIAETLEPLNKIITERARTL